MKRSFLICGVVCIVVFSSVSSILAFAALPNVENAPLPQLRSVEDCTHLEQVTYTAAVIEFEPVRAWTETGGVGVMLKNVASITDFATQAKSMGADIIISPEYGVQSLDMYTNDTNMFLSLTQIVPNPEMRAIPCDNEEQLANYEAVSELSCVARTLEMYMVVDMAEQAPCEDGQTCHETGLNYYNTQVVFDRTGAVIARYRKQNLYLEPQFTPGPAVDSLALFTTDFGVTFTLQICFDITFEHPAYSNVLNNGVRDVVMSTAWVDEVPFLPAINVQNGWSRGIRSNLMVSGYHWPEHTKLGSGIYRGYSDLKNIYSYDANSGNELVISPIKTCKTAPATVFPRPILSHAITVKYPRKGRAEREHVMLHEDLSVYNRTILPTSLPGMKNTVTLCHEDNLCCTVEYQHSRSDLIYQLMAFSGVLKKGGGTYQIYSQVCGIVWCDGLNWETCSIVDQFVPKGDEFGPFTLSGTYSVNAVFPVGLTRNLTLIPNSYLNFTAQESVFSIEANETINDLMSVAVFGRWFERDP